MLDEFETYLVKLKETIRKEGDSYKWDYKEFECDIKRNDFGCWCGYVNVPDIYVGKDWVPKRIQCHGGITYTENFDGFIKIGFDCGHIGDILPNFSYTSQYVDYNRLEYRDKEYVISNVNSIVDQLLEIPFIKRAIRIDEIIDKED